METVQQNGRFTLFSIKFLSIYSILYVNSLENCAYKLWRQGLQWIFASKSVLSSSTGNECFKALDLRGRLCISGFCTDECMEGSQELTGLVTLILWLCILEQQTFPALKSKFFYLYKREQREIIEKSHQTLPKWEDRKQYGRQQRGRLRDYYEVIRNRGCEIVVKDKREKSKLICYNN